MALLSLHMERFRQFTSWSKDALASFVLLTGHNGSGKTSCLEAIYYLAHGRSFRTQRHAQLCQQGQHDFLVAGTWSDGSGQSIPLGVHRHLRGEVEMKWHQQPVTKHSEITRHMPMVVLNTDSHRLLASGPKERRALLDWGCYYEFEQYGDLWRRYQRALAQRNAALKYQPDAYTLWDEEYVVLGEAIHALRRSYVEAIEPLIQKHWDALMGECLPLSMAYQAGWASDTQGLAAALRDSRSSDLSCGFTHKGIHRADWQGRTQERRATQWLSQGQQKVWCYAIKLAQAERLYEQSGQPCTVLVDDLPAELDALRQSHVMQVLADLPGQCFLTAIDATSIFEHASGFEEMTHIPLHTS